jgi:hypothetical protein
MRFFAVKKYLAYGTKKRTLVLVKEREDESMQ